MSHEEVRCGHARLAPPAVLGPHQNPGCFQPNSRSLSTTRRGFAEHAANPVVVHARSSAGRVAHTAKSAARPRRSLLQHSTPQGARGGKVEHVARSSVYVLWNSDDVNDTTSAAGTPVQVPRFSLRMGN